MATPLHETPTPKMPDPAARPKPVRSREAKIDRQMEGTFPASDPPSYSGGNHAIDAPAGRESQAPTPGTHDVQETERNVKGDAAPDKD
jgi:hypothetical protein